MVDGGEQGTWSFLSLFLISLMVRRSHFRDRLIFWSLVTPLPHSAVYTGNCVWAVCERCLRRQVSHLKAILTSSNSLAATMEWSRKTIFPTHRLKRHLWPCKTCAMNKIPDSGTAPAVLTEGWLHHCSCYSSSNLRLHQKDVSGVGVQDIMGRSGGNSSSSSASAKKAAVGSICSQPLSTWARGTSSLRCMRRWWDNRHELTQAKF